MSLFSRIFGKKDQVKPKEKTESLEINQKELRDFFIEEIENSKYIKSSGREAVLRDCLHEISLLSGTELSKEEKKTLGFSIRAKVTIELVDVLTDEGISYHTSPREVINLLYNTASRKYHWHNNINNFIKVGIKEMELILSDGEYCDWCKSINGEKVPASLDFLKQIQNNCTCDPYCYLIVKPVINFDD